MLTQKFLKGMTILTVLYAKIPSHFVPLSYRKCPFKITLPWVGIIVRLFAPFPIEPLYSKEDLSRTPQQYVVISLKLVSEKARS
jgi:hypothetical protein